MNRKGFTFVELLVVISILSLVMIVAYPGVQKMLSRSKQGIDQITRKNLEESAKTFAQEIYMCDHHTLTRVRTTLNNSSITCNQAKQNLKKGFKVTVGALKTNDYFNDRGNKCDNNGQITIKETNDKITAKIENNVKCK